MGEENKENLKEDTVEKNDATEKNSETPSSDKASTKKKKVKLSANIKYGNELHNKGEVISIDSKDFEEFKAAGVIEIEKE